MYGLCLPLNHYLLDLPKGCNKQQRMLLLGGLMHTNYADLEKPGE